MNSIRWTVTDRSTGKAITVAHPYAERLRRGRNGGLSSHKPINHETAQRALHERREGFKKALVEMTGLKMKGYQR